MTDQSLDNIFNAMPQLHCASCGYDDCYQYAKALATKQDKDITKCVPGKDALVNSLHNLLQDHLAVVPNTTPYLPKVAYIDENFCIGCTKCSMKCPVQAINGSRKMLHTILQDLCTGCNKCVQICPTDCIKMVDVEDKHQPMVQDYSKITLFSKEEYAAYQKLLQDTKERFLTKHGLKLAPEKPVTQPPTNIDLLSKLKSQLANKKMTSVQAKVIAKVKNLQNKTTDE